MDGLEERRARERDDRRSSRSGGEARGGDRQADDPVHPRRREDVGPRLPHRGARAIQRGEAARRTAAGGRREARYPCSLITPATFVSVCFASPNTIIVFGLTNSSFSIPANPGLIPRFS